MWYARSARFFCNLKKILARFARIFTRLFFNRKLVNSSLVKLDFFKKNARKNVLRSLRSLFLVGWKKSSSLRSRKDSKSWLFWSLDFCDCSCNRVHLSSPYSDGGADCHSKKTRPGANIFFYISFLCYKEFHGTIQFRFPKPPFSDPKKTLFDHCCLLSYHRKRMSKRYD